MRKDTRKIRYRGTRSRIQSYESGSDKVLESFRLLYSQSGTQEVLKIGQKCFERGLGNFSRWNFRKSRIGIKMI